MELIRCTEQDIQKLYDGSAWTWLGMNTDDDNLEAISNWFKEQGCPLKREEFYIVTGKQMNEFCGGLTGNNAYKDDLTILCIELDNITDVNKLFLKKFEVGARWFDDITESDRSRQG